MSAGADDAPGLACPVPFSGYDRVVLAHGGGGRVMHRLVESLFVAAFDNEALRRGHDGALVQAKGALAVTTDAFTVSPLFFPGGDIGRLAVCGTVNDLAMCGARPRYLCAAFVLEEGLLLADLESIVASMAATARACGVVIVAGDTKVVERGKGDGVYIAVTGIGEVVAPRAVEPARVRAGDAVIASGPLGEHGVAVMSVREGIAFDTPVTSDVAPLSRQSVAWATPCPMAPAPTTPMVSSAAPMSSSMAHTLPCPQRPRSGARAMLRARRAPRLRGDDGSGRSPCLHSTS